jgi:hypothetical protein
MKIGNTSYIVKSFYDDKKENLIEKFKHLLKNDIQKRALQTKVQSIIL